MAQVININDIKGNFFGGLPYNINWSFNNGPEPSKLTINVVSENGQYKKPTPNFRKTEKIKFGTFEFDGYLVGYSFNNSPSQKLLELEYVDKAINLDKWYVGLHSKHGDKNKNSTDRLILVGKQYHPCDTNQDSMISYAESNKKNIDNCDPCPFMPEDKYDYACDPVLDKFKIFDVYYTFNELIDKIPKEFKVNIKDKNKYKNYKAQHIGTLKSVLSSWCSDLGLAYYWDPFLSELVFIDRTKPIKIPSAPKNEKIIDLNEGENISNTFSRGFIGNFEKAGEIKNYQCSNETFETAKCLTISDLYEEKPKSGSNSDNNIKYESDVRELTAAISYLGPSARNVFLWFWFYQINNPTQLLEKYRITKDEEKNKAANAQWSKKILKYFGDMVIRDVYYPDGTPEQNSRFFECKDNMSDADKKRLEAEDKKNGYQTGKYSYYFFVAKTNEESAKKQIDLDIERAKNFLGKYWFKRFKARVPGATNLNSEVSVETPDGSASWHRQDEDIKGLPIFGFGHDKEKSRIGELVKEIEKDAKENDELERIYREAAKSFTQSKTTLKNLNSFILLERDPKWFPDEDFLQWYQSLFSYYQDISPQIFSTQDGRPEFLFKMFPEAREDKTIKLFICRELKNPFTVKFFPEKHPLEPKIRKQKIVDDQDVLGNTVLIKKGLWGLKDSTCVKIEFGGPRGITFYCPVQAFGNNSLIKTDTDKNDSGDTIETGVDDKDGGYSIYVKSSAEFTKVLPKIQYVYTKQIKDANVGKIDFNIKQITEENVQLLNGKKCLIDKGLFNDYAKTVSEFSQYSSTEPQRTMSFKTAGIFPLKYNCSQGLSSLQISITDDGVYTNYSFEDLVVEPPSEDYLNQYLKDSLQPKKSVGSLDPMTQTNFNSIRTAVGYLGN